MESAQRKVLLRVASAWRTCSSQALQVITGTAPIQFLAEERREVYLEQHDKEKARKVANKRLLRKWQRMWRDHTSTAQWTKRLIPDIVSWVTCPHRQCEYHLTQALTGHGTFKSFAKRCKFITDDLCTHCEDQVDTPEHTLFDCPKWELCRLEASLQLGRTLSVENLAETMVESKEQWKIAATMLSTIMKRKESERRRLNSW